MGECESDRREDLVRRFGQDENHGFGDDGLFINDGLDLGQSRRPFVMAFTVATFEVAWHDESNQELP